MSNIITILKTNAEKYPDKIAIRDKDSAITYSQLWQQVRHTAAYYNYKNIKAGDRVLVFVPMSINLYVNMLAIFYIGAIAVFLDQWSSNKRLDLACQIAECKAMVGIAKAKLLWFVSSAFRKIPVYLKPIAPVLDCAQTDNAHEKQNGASNLSLRAQSRSGKLEAKTHSSIEPYPSQKSDTALITFTTGSTGRPKAAKRTHGFLLEQFDALLNVLQPKESDVDLISLPILVFLNLGVGSTSVIANFDPRKPGQMNPDIILNQLIDNNCTRIISSPYFLHVLSDYVIHYKKQVSKITHIYTGGATVYPDDCKLFINAFPNATSAVLYGSTEAEPISEISFKELAAFDSAIEKNGFTVGKTYNRVNVQIIPITEDAIKVGSKDELQKMFLGKNTIGEIIVSGHHVLTEYYNSEEAFIKNKIKADDVIWHRTGDAGFMDEAGQLYLTGRCNTLINYQGKILSPFVYEYMLNRMKEIYCGTVMLLNNKVTIIIEPQGKINQDEIIGLIKSSGLLYEDIRFVTHIPKDPRHFSKIDYEKLRNQL